MSQKTKVYIFIGASVLILFLLFWYEFKQKAKESGEGEQVYVEMPDADVKQVSDSKSHAYATFADNKKVDDIEEYWTQCQREEEEKKEERKAEEIISPSGSSGGYATPARPAPTTVTAFIYPLSACLYFSKALPSAFRPFCPRRPCGGSRVFPPERTYRTPSLCKTVFSRLCRRA